MEANHAPCPLCGKLIKTWDIDWNCPACGTLNRNWNHMSNCEWCRFAPHFFNCPHCKDAFDLMLLMFGSGGPTHESGRREEHSASRQSTYTIESLKMVANKVIQESDDNVKKFLTDDFSDLWEKVSFPFPNIVQCFAVYSLFVSPDDRLWIHLWLYENTPPDENEQPLGQLAMVYPSSSQESERDYKKIDCVINESF